MKRRRKINIIYPDFQNSQGVAQENCKVKKAHRGKNFSYRLRHESWNQSWKYAGGGLLWRMDTKTQKPKGRERFGVVAPRAAAICTLERRSIISARPWSASESANNAGKSSWLPRVSRRAN